MFLLLLFTDETTAEGIGRTPGHCEHCSHQPYAVHQLQKNILQHQHVTSEDSRRNVTVYSEAEIIRQNMLILNCQ